MYKIISSLTVTIIKVATISDDINITTTIISISKIIKTISNFNLSKLTFDSHNPNPQLKLPQVLTRMNPLINNIANNKTPHIISMNKSL